MNLFENLQKLHETDSKTKAKRLFSNPSYMSKIKTFAIFTAENQDKQNQNKRNNTEQNKELKTDLSFKNNIENDISNSNYSYYKVKGKYENTEHSFIIYNITLENTVEYARKYKQQSFIFGKNKNGLLKFEFWANQSKSGYSYKLVDSKDKFDILDDNAENYYTQIARDFKITIPFDKFEVAPEDMIESIKIQKEKNKYSDEFINKLICESIDMNIAPKYRYYDRIMAYGKNKKGDI